MIENIGRNTVVVCYAITTVAVQKLRFRRFLVWRASNPRVYGRWHGSYTAEVAECKNRGHDKHVWPKHHPVPGLGTRTASFLGWGIGWVVRGEGCM